MSFPVYAGLVAGAILVMMNPSSPAVLFALAN